MSPPPAALELQHVTKHFGAKVAVDDLSLTLAPGSFLGLLGRNGAGKSTTLKMVTGLVAPTSGTIRVLGKGLDEDPLWVKRQLGVMPEDMALLEMLRGPQYLRFVGRMYGLDDAAIDARAAELFDTLDLKPGPKTLIAEYSFGMKKKLALCAAGRWQPRRSPAVRRGDRATLAVRAGRRARYNRGARAACRGVADMFSIPIRMGAPLALTAAFGCTLHITEEPTAATTDASAGSTGTSEATPTTTTDPTQVTATDPGTSGTSGAPTGTTAETGTAETGPEPPQWCNGFSPEVTEFTVHNNKDEVIVDGSALAAECGGQGTIMIPVYPRFGGFVPDSDSVAFDVTLDVEGYNVGPDGHFFAVASHVHTIHCGQEHRSMYT